jgi:hypothetical protein
VGFLDRFRTPRAPASPADSDRLILRQLEGLGANLGLPRHVIHYLYFESESDARRAAEEAPKTGWDATVTAPNDGIPQWSVRAESTRVVDETTVVAFRAWFEQLAGEYDGEYDGWEAASQP